MKFGEKLHELRERAGLSRAELAERSGLSARSLEGWELCRRQPAWWVLLELSRGLRLPAEVFVECIPRRQSFPGGMPP